VQPSSPIKGTTPAQWPITARWWRRRWQTPNHFRSEFFLHFYTSIFTLYTDPKIFFTKTNTQSLDLRSKISTSDLTFLSYFGLVSVWLFFAFWTEMSLDCYEFLAKSVISIWKWCIVFLEKSWWWMFLRNFMCSSSFLCEFCDLIWRFWREKSFCVCAIKVSAAMIDLTSLWLSDALQCFYDSLNT